MERCSGKGVLIESGLLHSSNENRLRRKKQKLNPPENGLIDVGVDIVQIDPNGYTLVQCKNGYNTGLRIDHLAGFYMMMANHIDLNGCVYYTSKISNNITDNHVNKRIEYKRLLMDNDSNVNIDTDEIVTDSTIIPYDYQLEATDTIINHFKTHNMAILSLPCGCGKTYTSYLQQ